MLDLRKLVKVNERIWIDGEDLFEIEVQKSSSSKRYDIRINSEIKSMKTLDEVVDIIESHKDKNLKVQL